MKINNAIPSLLVSILLVSLMVLPKCKQTFPLFFRTENTERQPGKGEIKLTISTQNSKYALAGQLARQMKMDSQTMAITLNDTNYYKKFGYHADNILCVFLPGNYIVPENITPFRLLDTMFQLHKAFWDEERLSRARKYSLSTKKVYILASIIEKETKNKDEMRKIAGVYLNRLKAGMKLGANPTVCFIKNDFSSGILTEADKAIDSPYNTYKYYGLPPGPIGIPSMNAINAVLNPEESDYLYFCAKGDGSELHNFSVNLDSHKENIKTYKDNKNIGN